MSHVVTFDDVQASIRLLLQQGLPITLANVRSQLGHRGSMTTISKYVAQWRQEQYLQDVPVPQSAVPAPDPIFSAVQNVWQQLVGVNQEQLSELKEQHAAQVQEFDDRIHHKDNQIQDLTQHKSKIEAELDLKNKQEKNLREELAQEKHNYSLAHQKIIDLQNYQQQAMALVSSIQEGMNQQLLEIQKQSQRQLEDCKKAAEVRCSAIQLQMEQERHEFLVTIDKLQTEHAALIQRLERQDTIRDITKAWESFTITQQKIFHDQLMQSERAASSLNQLFEEWPKISRMLISQGLSLPYSVDFLVKLYAKNQFMNRTD